MRLSEFFEEDNGRLSNMRLNTTVLVLTGCFMLGYALVVLHGVDANVIAASTMVITIGIGGKVVQKKDEAS